MVKSGFLINLIELSVLLCPLIRKEKMKMLKIKTMMLLMGLCASMGFSTTVTLKTDDLEDCIGIMSFLANTRGEIFLYSMRTYKVFKFNENGDFQTSFGRKGIGPGEITRVL
jgi:hypothetical protein